MESLATLSPAVLWKPDNTLKELDDLGREIDQALPIALLFSSMAPSTMLGTQKGQHRYSLKEGISE